MGSAAYHVLNFFFFYRKDYNVVYYILLYTHDTKTDFFRKNYNTIIFIKGKKYNNVHGYNK